MNNAYNPGVLYQWIVDTQTCTHKVYVLSSVSSKKWSCLVRQQAASCISVAVFKYSHQLPSVLLYPIYQHKRACFYARNATNNEDEGRDKARWGKCNKIDQKEENTICLVFSLLFFLSFHRLFKHRNKKKNTNRWRKKKGNKCFFKNNIVFVTKSNITGLCFLQANKPRMQLKLAMTLRHEWNRFFYNFSIAVYLKSVDNMKSKAVVCNWTFQALCVCELGWQCRLFDFHKHSLNASSV